MKYFMYKISKDFDFSLFQGKSISQICFGLNVITVFFSDDIYIQWSGAFEITRNKETKYYKETYPVQNDFGLLYYLNTTPTSICTDADRNNLLLIFDDDNSIKLFGDDAFESFTINVGEKRVIV